MEESKGFSFLLFFFNFKMYLIFAALGLHCTGFLWLWWLFLLWGRGSLALSLSGGSTQAHTVAPWHVGYFRTRDRTGVPSSTGRLLTTGPPRKSHKGFSK